LGEASSAAHRPWWAGATGYEVYVRSFADANNDGIGDLEGIRRRLPYLIDLGIDAVWVTPFYPSPGFDHGYDVADYCDVDPAHGTLADFDRLTAEAHRLGLRIMVDLVPNHTSSHHAWFRSALEGPESPYRDFYIWHDPAPDGRPPNNWVSHFGGPAWTLDETSGQYYCHLFLPEQPDLNWANPAVADAFDDILRFWCERGADGFRIDVAHGLVKDRRFRDNPQMRPITADMDPGEVFNSYEHRHDLDQNGNIDLYRRWNDVVAPYQAMLLGEVGPDAPVRVARYHAAGDAIHRTLFIDIGWRGWEPMQLRDRIQSIHLACPDSTAWVLDSHDADHAATRYGGGDLGANRALCLQTLLVGLGGMPVLYQGQELGLEDGAVDPEDLADPISTRNQGATGRDGARTVMPWDDGPNNGFNEGATPWLRSKPRPRGQTVAGQTGEAASFLERYRRLLAARRSHPDLWAEPAVWIHAADPLLLAVHRGNTVVTANLDEHDALLPLPAGMWDVVFHSRDTTAHPPASSEIEVPAETGMILSRRATDGSGDDR
jgi:alpha-glucosidase